MHIVAISGFVVLVVLVFVIRPVPVSVCNAMLLRVGVCALSACSILRSLVPGRCSTHCSIAKKIHVHLWASPSPLARLRTEHRRLVSRCPSALTGLAYTIGFASCVGRCLECE